MGVVLMSGSGTSPVCLPTYLSYCELSVCLYVCVCVFVGEVDNVGGLVEQSQPEF